MWAWHSHSLMIGMGFWWLFVKLWSLLKGCEFLKLSLSCEITHSNIEVVKLKSHEVKCWSCEVLKFWSFEIMMKLWRSCEVLSCEIVTSWSHEWEYRIINDINLLQKLMSWRHNWNNVVFFTLIRILIGPNTPVHHNLAQNN